MNFEKPVFHKAYDAIVKIIATATAIKTNSIKKAAKEEKDISTSKEHVDRLIVSGDGSWRKRSFSSLFGFVSLSVGLQEKCLIFV